MSLEQYAAQQVLPAPAPALPPAAATLVDWARQADAAYSLAQRIAGTAFVPQQFRNKPEELAAAMLAGAEVGLSPMASINAFDPIQGRATPKAITLRAIALSHGCEIVMDESTATRCKMRGRRRGDTEWTTVVWDIGRAQALGLLSKDQWKRQPTAMLVARATSELARLVAADAILGIAYSSEELLDEVEPAEAPRRVQRARVQRLPAPPPEPDLDDGPAPQEEDTGPQPDELKPISKGKLTALNAALTGDLGLTDRNEKLAWLTAHLGRDIGSSAEVTDAEASGLLDWIAAQPAPGVPAEEPELDWPDVSPPGAGS